MSCFFLPSASGGVEGYSPLDSVFLEKGKSSSIDRRVFKQFLADRLCMCNFFNVLSACASTRGSQESSTSGSLSLGVQAIQNFLIL